MSNAELVALLCCDLGSIVRGRSLLSSELGERMRTGVGWTPANHALTPLGPLAEPNPFGSTGDLRLLPDPDTHVRVGPGVDASALELLLCDIVELDGQPWECCPRHFLRAALEQLRRELGLRLLASFEHEFQLLALDDPASIARALPPSALPFSLQAQREAEPFATDVMQALVEAGVQPERFFPEFAARQFEIPVAPVEGIVAADRSVVLKEVVREIGRRHLMRASFVPLLNPDEAGNGLHVHFDLLDDDGRSVLYDAARPAGLSELGGSFAAGILLHAKALSALTAASPISAVRLQPHRWSAGAVCLAERNREALLRIPPIALPDDAGEAGAAAGTGAKTGTAQVHLEYRGADSSANPYLALGGIVLAGLDGVLAGLPTPAILDRDPAQLDAEEAKRFGVGASSASLEDSLRALAGDETARGWMSPLLYEAYVSLKRAELLAVADLDLTERCRRYASVY